MSGKAYTMREMKAMVEYLTEHRLFAEIKGRKMWMDYANSNQTTRTWQSLKETFLKRILPDITNPYYKLTVQQIASFRQGCDLERKLNNKLEIQNVDEDSNSNSGQEKDPEPSNANYDEGHEAGEDPQAKKVERNRSSLDTIVIEPCYKTAEDIQKDLESPNKKNHEEGPSYKPSQTKSFRDYITYSEPLTPMLQEVLHDFESEDEEEEPQMQIVEYAEPNNEKDVSPPIEILDTENNDGDNEENQNLQSCVNVDSSNDEHSNHNNPNPDTIVDNDETECIGISDNSERNGDFISNSDIPNVTTANAIIEASTEGQIQQPKDSQKHSIESISGTDSILPNNQEAFKELRNAKSAGNQLREKPSISQNKSRKRSNSHEIQSDSQTEIRNNKIPRGTLNSKQSASDIERTAKNRDTVSIKSNFNLKKSRTKLHKQGNIPSEDQNTIQSVQNVDTNTINTENPENLTEHMEILPSNAENLNELGDHREGDIKITENEKTTPIPKADQNPTDVNEDVTRNKSKKHIETTEEYIQEVVNEVVILKSHSDSTSEHVVNTPKKKKAAHHTEYKVQRNKAVANIFGFSSGLSSRKKHMKHRKRLPSHHTINTSESDEWTSESESEYISPPRGRKNRQTRKYLKPKAAKILSLEEEGGLFVMYGKKIYPLVKDGKIIKSYTTYSPSKDTDHEESFWKLKYVEEKKKTEELTKLLKSQKPGHQKGLGLLNEDEVQAQTSTIAEITPTAIAHHQENVQQNKEIVQPQAVCKETEKIKEDAGESKTVKIKYSKNNEEVQLEGHWTHIHPVLEQLVHILHKDPDTVKEKPAVMEQEEKKVAQKESAKNLPTATRDSTPASVINLDDDVKEKVSKIEEEIFKEIEEREKADSTLDQSMNKNVTQRKGTRTRKSTQAADKNPAKKPKMSSDSNQIPEKPNDVTQQPQKQDDVTQQPHKQDSVTQQPQKQSDVTQQPPELENNKSVVSRRRTWTAKKMVNEKGSKEQNVNETKRVTRKSLQDAQVKYNFRSPPATSKNTKSNTKQKPKKRYPIQTFTSPDAICNDSIESSLGYQDSDASNLSLCLRKKRKSSYTVLNKGRAKSQRPSKRKSKPHADEYSSDSNISFVTAPLKSSHQSSSTNSEIYRTESYQLLFPQGKNIFNQLGKIDESPTFNKTYCINNNNYDLCDDLHIEKSSVHSNENIPSLSLVMDGESSSHITLPPSPVLSIVENISISKKELSSTNDVPVDMMSVDDAKQTMLNEYMSSDVDMSIPLMEQNYGLQKSRKDQSEQECHYNINVLEPQKMSESLISKVNAVKIEAPTLSESIHQKLKNLLLESAKKLANQMIYKSDNKDIETKMDIDDSEKLLKTKKKRCSTPRKRQSKRNSKNGNEKQEEVVAEEHTEMCGSKKSYPTPLLVVTDVLLDNANIIETEKANETKNTIDDKTKTKKKKDIIKVKITKPKKQRKDPILDNTLKKSKSSLQTDSGINDTESGVFLQGCEDSIDLIHNHSDTCLQANECIGSSVEVIEENAMSIVSLSSNSLPINELKTSRSLTNIKDDVLLEILCEDAQDAVNLLTDNKNQSMNEDRITHYSSDANISSLNSLMTEDLSDDPLSGDQVQKRVSKWYLLSEDETTNTNLMDTVPQPTNSNSGWGANLQQIFPVTCAVPDLSTITEENTPKTTPK